MFGIAGSYVIQSYFSFSVEQKDLSENQNWYQTPNFGVRVGQIYGQKKKNEPDKGDSDIIALNLPMHLFREFIYKRKKRSPI